MVSIVTAAPAAAWASASCAMTSAATSGWSPERTASGLSPGTASRAASTAAPVPSPSLCSATVTPSGRRPSTPSPGRVTQTTSVAPASRAASMTHSTNGLPHTACRTFGVSDFIRVPWPAAMISAVKGSAIRGQPA